MKVGFVGWRGMVGSVLRERMEAEGDFAGLEPTFFSTSNPGGAGPDVGQGATVLADASDLDALAAQDVVVTCQGGSWTEATWGPLRERGWTGIWIDAASALRMHPETALVLDPLNGDALREGLASGTRDFIGANCTVSLLLLGLAGLVQSGHVRWITTMSYQAASGAGARNLTELVAQMRHVGDTAADLLDDPASAALVLDQRVSDALAAPSCPTSAFGAPLAGSALPWIDRDMGDGQTREEWKASVEANKILGRQADPLPIDGLCVRIGALRSHAQAVTIQLDADLPVDEIEAMLDEAHPWSACVPNDKDTTLARLTPVAVSGSLTVPVGRVRKLKVQPGMIGAFTVGDQLLWGAAEPLRRMLAIVREHAEA